MKSALKDGALFWNCISQASHTTTSHSSMFTGLYPYNHGVRWVSGSRVKGKMIQELLKEIGYNTAAFIGGWTLTHHHISKGFDLFHTDHLIEDTTEGRHIFDPIDHMVDQTIEHLEKNKGRDNYVLIHSFDAHFTSRSDKEGKRKSRYMEEIRNQDRQLNRLHDYLKGGDYLMVITADHGDKLEGEHGYPYVYNHKGEQVGIHFHETELFDIQLRVPLIIFGSQIKQCQVEGLTRIVDISPTILGLLGLPPLEGVDGVDLSGSITGTKPFEHPKYAYSETYHAQLVEDNKYAIDMKSKYEWGWNAIDNIVSLRSIDRKLICSADGGLIPIYFYDLVEDPGEERNLIDDEGSKDQIKEMLIFLKEMLKDDFQYRYNMIKKEVKSIKNAIKRTKLKGI